MTNFYSAREAAEKLGLEYHTFLARSRKGQYSRIKIGWAVLFDKQEIDEHADDQTVAETRG